MTSPLAPPPREPAIDPTGLVIGVAVGIPVAVGTGAVLALARGVFGQTNAALILMIVVVAVAALGGRAAGVITALAAVVSFDFFHTEPVPVPHDRFARRHRDHDPAARSPG